MKQDNHWHSAVVYQLADGNFVIAETLDAAEEDKRPKTMTDGAVKYQSVKYNWNRGQPIVDFGDFKMAITDILNQ